MIEIYNLTASGWTDSANAIDGNPDTGATDSVAVGATSDTLTVVFSGGNFPTGLDTSKYNVTRVRFEVVVSGGTAFVADTVQFTSGAGVSSNAAAPEPTITSTSTVVYDRLVGEWGLAAANASTFLSEFSLALAFSNVGTKTRLVAVRSVTAYVGLTNAWSGLTPEAQNTWVETDTSGGI